MTARRPALYRFVFFAALFLVLGVVNHARAYIYQESDTTAESSRGATGGGDLIVLNGFKVTGGNNVINAIGVVFGTPSAPDPSVNGMPFKVVLWSDPNGDGLPNDALVLATANGIVSNSGTNSLLLTSITPTTITTQNFFVGIIMTHLAGQAPAGLDMTAPVTPTRSFLASSPAGSGNIYNLNSNTNPVASNKTLNIAGNWIICAYSTVPEPSTWATMALGAGLLGCVLRHRRLR